MTMRGREEEGTHRAGRSTWYERTPRGMKTAPLLHGREAGSGRGGVHGGRVRGGRVTRVRSRFWRTRWGDGHARGDRRRRAVGATQAKKFAREA